MNVALPLEGSVIGCRAVAESPHFGSCTRQGVRSGIGGVEGVIHTYLIYEGVYRSTPLAARVPYEALNGLLLQNPPSLRFLLQINGWELYFSFT